jgi:hypothetical protein
MGTPPPLAPGEYDPSWTRRRIPNARLVADFTLGRTVVPWTDHDVDDQGRATVGNIVVLLDSGDSL